MSKEHCERVHARATNCMYIHTHICARDRKRLYLMRALVEREKSQEPGGETWYQSSRFMFRLATPPLSAYLSLCVCVSLVIDGVASYSTIYIV